MTLPGPPKEPKIMARYPKIETIGSIGSIILGSFGGPGTYMEPTHFSDLRIGAQDFGIYLRASAAGCGASKSQASGKRGTVGA